VIEAREELGDEMGPALIDAFVARIEGRLADRADESDRALQRKRSHQKEMVWARWRSPSRCSPWPQPSPGFLALCSSAPPLS
jgi:hypothetical protein